MMSRNPFFTAGICGICVMACVLASCATKPKTLPAATVEPEVAAIVEDDVWSLLARGENDKARAFFLGTVDIDAADAQGRTPLHFAAESEDPALAGFFIARGAKVDALDNRQRSPLTISAEKLDSLTARVLVTSGANIHQSMSGSGSPAVIALRESGRFLSAILTPASMSAADGEGRTILHLAAEDGNVNATGIILKEGSLFTQKNRNGKTALDIALERFDSKNHAGVAEQLILAGAVSDNPLFTVFAPAVRTSNFNIRSADGMTTLHYIARHGYQGYLLFVLDKNVDVNTKNASGATSLHEAARSGNIRTLETLLDNGAEINAQDANGNSPLHIAAPPAAHLNVAKLLLSRSANINLRDAHGDSPLHIAIMLNRSEEHISTLLSNKADVTIRDIDGKTPLYIAIEKNRAACIPPLLEYGSDIFAVDNYGITPFEKAITENPSVVFSLITDETVSKNDSGGNTVLHLTVNAGGSTSVMRSILDRKASIDARNKAGDTSLTIAVRKNREEAGLLLLSREADIFAANAANESPLYLAFPAPERRDTELREWMLTPKTLSSRDGLGNTALHYLALWRYNAWIPYLIQRDANVEAANATGETPLFSAVKQNSPSTIDVLIANGASLFARDTLGNSALHAAVRWNAIAGAEKLLNLGLDINSHALNGKTPLHNSIRWGMTEMQTMLLKRNAGFEIRDAEGNTAFMESVLAGNSQSMEVLVKMGADINTRNFRGDTALHVAANMNRTDLSSRLLSWGVSIHARNALGRTPFQNALNNSPELLKVFLTTDRLNSSDDSGSSPLHIAVREKASVTLVKTILDLGARQSTVDNEGRNPVRLAVELDYFDIAKLLSDSGGNVFAAARDGRNAVEMAISKGETAIKALFSGEAINSKDPSGNTVLHYAARHGNTATVSLLLSLGANKEVRNIAAESPAEIAQRWRNQEAAALLN